MNELKQKYLNERREFFLEPDRIRLYVKDIDGDTETFIDYESLTTRTRRITRQSGRLYIIAMSFGIFAMMGFVLNLVGIPALMRWVPIWAVASVILFGFHLYKRRRYFLVDLNNDQSVFFIADQPSKEALEDFVKTMYESQKTYFRTKYFITKPHSDPESELKRFQWLLEKGFISEDEFEDMKRFLISQCGNPDANTPPEGRLPN